MRLKLLNVVYWGLLLTMFSEVIAWWKLRRPNLAPAISWAGIVLFLLFMLFYFTMPVYKIGIDEHPFEFGIDGDHTYAHGMYDAELIDIFHPLSLLSITTIGCILFGTTLHCSQIARDRHRAGHILTIVRVIVLFAIGYAVYLNLTVISFILSQIAT